MHWMTLPLRRYFDFQGRSRRREYWMFILGYILFVAVMALVMIAFNGGSSSDPSGLAIIPAAVIVLALLALIIPSLAVQVRRFHDRDMSGWFVLLNLVPYLGGLIVLVFMCLPGTRGPNRFGPDPKEDVAAVFR